MDFPTTSFASQALPAAIALPPRAARPIRPARRPPVRVLVVLSPDGFAECYATDNVQVHIASRLAVEPPDEILADRYLDLIIPEPFKRLFWPNRLRATSQVERRTLEDEADRQHYLHLVRGLREIAKGQQTAPLAILRARRAAG